MNKLKITILCVLVLSLSCEEEVFYDLESQLAADIAIVDQHLADNSIDHRVDESGLRYEVLNQATGQELEEGQYALFEITIWQLDGTFYGSNNEETDAINGGQGRVFLLNRYEFSGFRRFGVQHYFNVMAPKMRLGDRYRVYVPSPLGFGFETEFLSRPIAPNTNLIVEMEMTEILNYGD